MVGLEPLNDVAARAGVHGMFCVRFDLNDSEGLDHAHWGSCLRDSTAGRLLRDMFALLC